MGGALSVRGGAVTVLPSTTLPVATARRLLATFELAQRPGSEGERVSAEHATGRLMVAHADAFRAIFTASATRIPPAPGWRDLCDECMRHPLRSWEAEFVRSLRGFPRISPKQRDVLHGIAERLGLLEPAA